MRAQPQGDLRGLKALVGILGALIVLGTALVIGVVIHRLYARSAAPSMAAVPVAANPASVSSALPPGEHVAGIAGAGGEVAVWVSGPAGDRVLLIDPASGRISVALSGAR